MADTYVQQRIHLIWSTRERAPTLTLEARKRLWPYFGGIIRHYGGVMLAAGGMADHIHIYADYPKTIALSQFVNTIKSNSSRWLNDKFFTTRFHWQSGYGGFTVGRGGDKALQEYIWNQDRHHASMTFEQEYMRLLDRHHITYDTRYVLD
jgi:REP element-mobilizing transposase RayT